MEIPENYRGNGREKAFIKHTLLEKYLERLFMIIGRYEKKICYVDCFAGPWEEGSKDLKDTSISISLSIMKDCKEALKKMGHEVEFKAIYIEKNEKAFQKLDSFLSRDEWSEIDKVRYNGEFYDKREEILKACEKDYFTFFFIDPKGWKKSVEVPTLKPLLERPKSEFLINFMFDFIRRFHMLEEAREIFITTPNTSGMTPNDGETYLLDLYRNDLKSVFPAGNAKPRSAYVKVLNPTQNRTMYDLVYLTRHPKGIVEFMKVSEDLDVVQRSVRAKAKQYKREEMSGQGEFSFEMSGELKRDEADMVHVKQYWLDKLDTVSIKFGIMELADMHEETGWFVVDFQKAFKELLDEGLVKNLDDVTGRRRTQFVRFDKSRGEGERLVKIEQ